MIEKRDLYEVLNRPRLDITCRPYDHPQELFDAAGRSLAAGGFALTCMGVFSVKRSMVAIPAEVAATVESALHHLGLTPDDQVGLFACFESADGSQVILQLPGPAPFAPDDPQFYFLGLGRQPRLTGERIYLRIEGILESTGALRGMSWLPKPRWTGGRRRSYPDPLRWAGSWPATGGFGWLNLIDDEGLIGWLDGPARGGPFHRVRRLRGGGTLLALWDDPLGTDYKRAFRHAARVWRAAQAGKAPPRPPRGVRAGTARG
ncbi:MAG TPA: hypothetical protein VGB42_03950 [Candidatus Thermoplasmatota archaeon]